MQSKKGIEVTTFDQSLASEILEVFQFFKRIGDTNENVFMEDSTAVELARMYFTVSNLPQYSEEEEEEEEEEADSFE